MNCFPGVSTEPGHYVRGNRLTDSDWDTTTTSSGNGRFSCDRCLHHAPLWHCSSQPIGRAPELVYVWPGHSKACMQPDSSGRSLYGDLELTVSHRTGPGVGNTTSFGIQQSGVGGSSSRLVSGPISDCWKDFVWPAATDTIGMGKNRCRLEYVDF